MKTRTSLQGKPDGMPPWFIEKNVGIQRYKGDISLSNEEIAKVAKWADSGAPRGNPADMPPPLTFLGADEWKIGTPDLIVTSPSFAMKGTAPDWWGPIGETPTGLTEDRYVAAVEMKEVSQAEKKSDRQTIGGLYIFHHLIWSAIGGDGGLSDAGWPIHEVGRNADFFDPDAGRLLKAGSKLVFSSAHLHASGTDTKAAVQIGFKFLPKDYQPKKKVQHLDITATLDLDIRPLEAGQKIETFSTLTENVKIVAFEPHMHAAGVRMCLDAIYGSTTQTLSCSLHHRRADFLRPQKRRLSALNTSSCCRNACSASFRLRRTWPSRFLWAGSTPCLAVRSDNYSRKCPCRTMTLP